MVHIHASSYDDVFIATDFRHSLSSALLDNVTHHLIAICVGLFPSALFAFRVWRSTSGVIIHSRFIRGLLSFSALLYFPFLSLWTSIVLTIFTFLLRQTADVERLLHRLCDAVTTPVVDKLSAVSSPSATFSLLELKEHMRNSANIVRKREALVAKVGRRSPLRALVRMLTAFGISAALAALAYVAESRFRDALASTTCPIRSKRLSRIVVIAILRAEMVSAVLLPFKASVKMYLYGTLVVAVILVCGPIWLLW